ncbi:MAG: 16S rRNA (adenine(1518)-N(6)/adenine(1519)-N(6))-dimethyltransferase RsmA [Pirellulaceae bacterium]
MGNRFAAGQLGFRAEARLLFLYCDSIPGTMMTSTRQTAKFLMQRFEEAGLRPDTRKGQNFLIDLNLLDILADSADLGPRDVVLEVGTGLGSLTTKMAPLVAAVVTVEVDSHLQQLAAEELADFHNVTMLCQDVLRNKNNIHPHVLETIQDKLGSIPEGQLKLVANLPYNIATPLISNLLLGPVVPVSMTVTIQKELADRITAGPSTKDYSSLSVWVQSLCDASILRVMPPSVFWPRPKVNSAIIQIVPRAEKRARIPDLTFFHTFVRAMFFHRRKFLRSELVSACKDQLGKPEVDAVMAELGLGPQSRAEELPVETMLTLCEAIRSRTQPAA